ncbi:MAG: hypothetical protein AMXMBFR44_5710 [Candidatus Campbellbacteria bacterium]
MGQSSFPFDISEDNLHDLIRSVAYQYRELGRKRVGEEVKKKLRLCSYNTTRNLSVTATRHGTGRTLVLVSATAPNGRPYTVDVEVPA